LTASSSELGRRGFLAARFFIDGLLVRGLTGQSAGIMAGGRLGVNTRSEQGLVWRTGCVSCRVNGVAAESKTPAAYAPGLPAGSLTLPACPRHQSYRRASIGSSRDAFHAG